MHSTKEPSSTSPSNSKQKKCFIRKTRKGKYAWVGQIACRCVMAVAENDTIYDSDLDRFRDDGELTYKEVRAIRSFDNQCGTEDDRSVIEKIAKRLNVQLLEKVYR